MSHKLTTFLFLFSNCHNILKCDTYKYGMEESINLCMVGRNSRYKALVPSFHFSYKIIESPKIKPSCV